MTLFAKLVTALAVLLSLAADAQAVRLGQVATATSTGSVSGRMTCTDTQRAARFATVALVPVDSFTSGDERGRGRYTARTDLDGNFTISGVPVGDYYVTGSATGYVSQSALLQAAAAADAQTLQTVAARFPILHVSQGGASTASLSIDRGAVIAGKLQWDDGTPAAGIQLSAITLASLKSTNQRAPNGFNPGFDGGFNPGGGGFATTDDRGNYRITGLPAGEYLVRATVQAPLPQATLLQGRGNFARTTSIVMYAPGKVRTGDAKSITLSVGEEHDDIPFTLDLRALHTVSGRATTTGGDGKVSSGNVTITDSTDTTLSRTAAFSEDGSFTLNYVPEGTYTMTVPYASSAVATVNTRQRGRQTGNFQPFQQTLSVTDTDITGVPVVLTPTPAQ